MCEIFWISTRDNKTMPNPFPPLPKFVDQHLWISSVEKCLPNICVNQLPEADILFHISLIQKIKAIMENKIKNAVLSFHSHCLA